VRSAGGRVTEVATNRAGFRGPAWAARRSERSRVLVVGDSQALGLHVAWNDTFAALLGQRFDVLDAAVPTWGPTEYARITEELAPTGRPDVVVYVVNVGNDFREALIPNRLRTTARDGWAVPPSHAGDDEVEFPGRAWLFGRSHLVYATRQVLGRATSVAPIRADAPLHLVDELGTLTRATPPDRSRLGPFLAASREACRRIRARMVLAVVPLDVQVHSREWAKYRTRPIDMRATEELAAGALADARRLGIAAVDLLPVLREASPGAFLPDDPHLSARGHAAVARALVAPITGRAPDRVTASNEEGT
jgi:SGNH hydrolase-like domain, acetyltransferase AlgX